MPSVTEETLSRRATDTFEIWNRELHLHIILLLRFLYYLDVCLHRAPVEPETKASRPHELGG
jgi:hypothetical protein